MISSEQNRLCLSFMTAGKFTGDSGQPRRMLATSKQRGAKSVYTELGAEFRLLA